MLNIIILVKGHWLVVTVTSKGGEDRVFGACGYGCLTGNASACVNIPISSQTFLAIDTVIIIFFNGESYIWHCCGPQRDIDGKDVEGVLCMQEDH